MHHHIFYLTIIIALAGVIIVASGEIDMRGVQLAACLGKASYDK